MVVNSVEVGMLGRRWRRRTNPEFFVAVGHVVEGVVLSLEPKLVVFLHPMARVMRYTYDSHVLWVNFVLGKVTGRVWD